MLLSILTAVSLLGGVKPTTTLPRPEIPEEGPAWSILLSKIMVALVTIAELFLLLQAIRIANNCSTKGTHRTFHIILASFFTMPYAMLQAVFNNCAIKSLGGKGKKASRA